MDARATKTEIGTEAVRRHVSYYARPGCGDVVTDAPLKRPDPAPRKPEIRDLVGEAGWRRLTAAVRARFATTPPEGTRWHFRGIMDRVAVSGLGWLMAWCSRLIGSPVVHRGGENVPIDVYVYGEEDGTAWERVYHFARTAVLTAKTVKRIDADRRLLECFGRGVGMELDVYEHDAALHFRSTSFFVDLGRWRLRLPELISPGTLLVEHIDEGEGRFRFRMTVDHMLFGRLFFQDGVFTQVMEA